MAEGHVTCYHARGMLVAVAARGKWQSAMPRASLPARTLQLRLARASSSIRVKLHAISHGAASYNTPLLSLLLLRALFSLLIRSKAHSLTRPRKLPAPLYPPDHGLAPR